MPAKRPLRPMARFLAWVILFAVTALVIVLPELFPGNAPLYSAIDRNDQAEVSRLLAAGADPNSRACRFGDGVGGDCTLKRYEDPPLVFAIYLNQPGNVQLLLEAGADPNGRTWEGKTALILAVNEGRTQIVQALLAAGADAQAASTLDGETPLHYGPKGPGGSYPDWGDQAKELDPEIRVMLEHASAR